VNYAVSLGKLREYHGLFKNIGGNFSIDPAEFMQIFQLKDDRDFAIWDTTSKGVVDALELFSGLILFSDAKAEDKIRCSKCIIQFCSSCSTSMR
jgi:hypothetical protein